MEHQISRRKIVQYLKFFNLIPHFDLIISRLPNIVKLNGKTEKLDAMNITQAFLRYAMASYML